ncbi:MAG: PaaI family thioesterase [Actinobacteria bacterium]|nr:MAG: PaaI family thioesterase [Actinomycetota bacterium]
MSASHLLPFRIHRARPARPYHAGFGISVEHAAAGYVLLGWEARSDHRNLQGLVHGGVLATLVDIAMGLAIRTVVGPSRRHVTIDLGVHYLRPARPGRLEAAGTVLRVGSQVGFAEGSVTDATGRSLVRASGTYSVTQERTDGATG